MAHALDDLNCGYCHAPIVDHGESNLKICVHRLTIARRDLAENVLAAIPEVGVTWDNDGYESWIAAPDYRDSVVSAIRQVFAESSIELTTTQKGKGK